MRLSKIAIAVALGALCSTPAFAGQAGHWYAGADAGFSFATNTDKTIPDSGSSYITYELSDDTSGGGIGGFAGYNITNWLAVEAGINVFGGQEVKGKIKYNGADVAWAKVDYAVWGPEIAARLNYTFDDKGSDVFLRAGLAYLMTEVDEDKDLDGIDGKNNLAPLIGIGVNYAFNPSWALRAGFTYYFNAIEIEYDLPNNTSMKYEGDLGYIYAGFQYTFGAAAPAAAATAAPQQVQKTHTLDAATLFPFNGDKLSAAGQEKVAEVVADSRNYDNVSYEVYGYTDRLGSDAYNLALSERRAAAVAAELRQNGVTDESLRIVEGRGKANPVTGDQCDNVAGRKALIECLQPDRRVEVVVNGQETMSSTL